MKHYYVRHGMTEAYVCAESAYLAVMASIPGIRDAAVDGIQGFGVRISADGTRKPYYITRYRIRFANWVDEIATVDEFDNTEGDDGRD